MATTETAREKALVNYRKKLLEHRELDARLKDSMFYTVLFLSVRLTEANVNLILAVLLTCQFKLD